MTRPPARQWQTCCTVVSSPWSSRASVAPGMKYLLISCSVTTAPHWIPLWLLGCSLLDVDVIRVMSCVLCCRAECGHTQECGESWSRMLHLRLRAGADPLWYSQHPNIISLHVMYKKSTICIHSDSFVIHNVSILFWCILVAYAVLRYNDVLRQYSTDITIDNDGGHHGWAIFWAESSQGDIDG